MNFLHEAKISRLSSTNELLTAENEGLRATLGETQAKVDSHKTEIEKLRSKLAKQVLQSDKVSRFSLPEAKSR